jgi:hypothetical protein
MTEKCSLPAKGEIVKAFKALPCQGRLRLIGFSKWKDIRENGVKNSTNLQI